MSETKTITKEEYKYKVVYKSDQKGWNKTSYFTYYIDAFDYYSEKKEENKEPVLVEIETLVTETVLLK